MCHLGDLRVSALSICGKIPAPRLLAYRVKLIPVSTRFAIETDDLGKRYGDVTAVERLSLRVAEGEIYAFLGLNGAEIGRAHV